jgi:hypothetical protein
MPPGPSAPCSLYHSHPRQVAVPGPDQGVSILSSRLNGPHGRFVLLAVNLEYYEGWNADHVDSVQLQIPPSDDSGFQSLVDCSSPHGPYIYPLGALANSERETLQTLSFSGLENTTNLVHFHIFFSPLAMYVESKLFGE